MAKPLVKCNVANCTFWGEGNQCQAEAILVEIDANSTADFDMEAGAEPYGEAEYHHEARQKKETCCHTFRAKDE